MPHFLKGSGDEVVGPVLFVHLLPLLQLLFSQQVLLGRVVGLVMAGQFLLDGRDIDDPALRSGSARPGIVDLVLLLLLLLVLVPLDPAGQQSVQDLVDLHLLPLRRHEVALGRRMRVDGEGVFVIVLDLEGRVGQRLGRHFATPDPID